MSSHSDKLHPQLTVILNIDLCPRKSVPIEISLGLEAIWTNIRADDEEIRIGAIQQGHRSVGHGCRNA